MKKRKSTKAYKARFGYRCMNCGEPASHVHHLIPLSKGGPDCPDYWILLCPKCHKAKGLHSDSETFFTGLATKKFYAESLIQRPKIEIPIEPSIIGPQRKINLLRFVNQKVEPQAKIEASTRMERIIPEPDPAVSKICPTCESIFSGRSDKVFCSDRCRYGHHNKIRRMKQKELVQIAEGFFEFLSA